MKTRQEIADRVQQATERPGNRRVYFSRRTKGVFAALAVLCLAMWGAEQYWQHDATHAGLPVDGPRATDASSPDNTDVHFWVMDDKPIGSFPNDHIVQANLCLPSLPSNGVWILATSTVESVTTGFVGNWNYSDTGLTLEEGPEQDTINAYLQAHHLSKTEMALHGMGTSSTSLVEAVLKSSQSIPESSWRLVIMDVENHGTPDHPAFAVNWAKVVQPALHDTLATAVQSLLGRNVRNVTNLWSAESGDLAFALYSFLDNQGTHLVNFVAERGSEGGWKLTHSYASPGLSDSELKKYPIYNADFGESLPQRNVSFMAISGLVNRTQIVRVRLTYVDGKQVTVPVVNGAFGDVRIVPGNSGKGVTRIEGLDVFGRVVYP